MKLHICKENPCPEQDKECAEILKNGFTISEEEKCECGEDTPEYLVIHGKDKCVLRPQPPASWEEEFDAIWRKDRSADVGHPLRNNELKKV